MNNHEQSIDSSIAERIWEQVSKDADSALTVQMRAVEMKLIVLRTAYAELEGVPADNDSEQREKLFRVALSVMDFVIKVLAFYGARGGGAAPDEVLVLVKQSTTCLKRSVPRR